MSHASPRGFFYWRETFASLLELDSMNGPEAESTSEKYESVLPKEQRRALLYRTLSLLWIFPSLGALWIVAPVFKNLKTTSTIADALRSIRLEEWLAFCLLLAHAAFIFLAWRSRKEMKSR